MRGGTDRHRRAPEVFVDTFSDTDALHEVYPIVSRLRQQLDTCLEAFESGSDESVACQQKLGALTNQFNQKLQLLKTLLHKETPSLSHSEAALWKRRVDKMIDDGENFRKSYDKQLGHIYRTQIEEENRRKLLPDRDDREIDAIRQYAREKETIGESHTLLDSITEQGRLIVDQIMTQNKALKGAKRRMLDIGSSLGVSSSLLGIISRRRTMDRWLVYGCMLFTILLFIGLYNFVISGRVFSRAFLFGADAHSSFTRGSGT
eukprot:GHVQ01015933.1.p1 GENE.GHVQ01015933.1~~GHVQ01015933.1.p1  ORF type:complete len:261 (+),score=32.78 GHVQ01015933.1:312-1094(+)